MSARSEVGHNHFVLEMRLCVVLRARLEQTKSHTTARKKQHSNGNADVLRVTMHRQSENAELEHVIVTEGGGRRGGGVRRGHAWGSSRCCWCESRCTSGWCGRLTFHGVRANHECSGSPSSTQRVSACGLRHKRPRGAYAHQNAIWTSTTSAVRVRLHRLAFGGYRED